MCGPPDTALNQCNVNDRMQCMCNLPPYDEKAQLLNRCLEQGCFRKGSKILTHNTDGSLFGKKNIEDVVVGDLVEVHDQQHQFGEPKFEPVIFKFDHEKEEIGTLLKFKLQGSDDQTLTVTESHILVVRDGNDLIQKPAF